MKSCTTNASKYVFAVVFIFTLANYLIYTFNAHGNDIAITFGRPEQDQRELSRFIINTAGCKIPDVVTNSTYIKYYFKPVAPIKCQEKRPPLFESNYTSIYMNESALLMYGYKNTALVKCCCMWLRRMPMGDSSKPPDDSVIFQEECVFFNFSYTSPDEFIKVHCFNMKTYPKSNVILASTIKKLKPFYTDYFYFVIPPQKTSQSNEDKVNILILGLDSISRLNFHRQMPITYHLLEKLDAVEFFGFNKIGDNTFPNVIAMLTGNSSGEIKNTCFNESAIDRVFDNCNFIWNYYKTRGYLTAFIEDGIKTGLFNYKPDRKGFVKQPTDAYWDNFYRAATTEIGNRIIGGQPYCFGARKIHEIMLEYIIRFTTVMNNNKQPYFGHVWQSVLTHEDVNQPRNGDVAYSDLLIKLNDTGLLNNTVLFFMSDHGFRFGNVRKTYQGMLEDRLPFIFLKLPDWMKERYPHLVDNLKINSRRLVTMYDIYETFKQLLEPSSLSASNWNIGKQRGHSLLAPIHENRTCTDANIPNQWCVCEVSVSVPSDDSVVIAIAKFIVEHINENILKNYRECVHLSLDEVIYARKAHTGEKSDVNVGYFKEVFTVVLKVAPSNALFEGTVLRNTKGTSVSLTLSDTIGRLQLFKNESLCITNHFAQMYCFCSDLL